MDGLLQDVRHAARRLARSPGFTAAAVLTLGLGIGAVTAVFTVVDGLLLRPFPFADQERLFLIWQRDEQRGQPFVEVSYPAYREWREQSRGFEAMAIMPSVNQRFTWTGGEEARKLPGRLVSADFFKVLGVRPALGRDFETADDGVGAARVAILGHGLWQRGFGSDPGVIGRSLTLDGAAVTVVGVMPSGFEYPNGATLWTNLVPALPRLVDDPNVMWAVVLARLKDGVPPAQARAELDGIVRRQAERAGDAGWGAVVTPLVDELLGDARRRLLVLLAAVAVLLLIACSSVTGLWLVRASAGTREIGVRVALGADRRRIARQVLTEGALIALGSGLLGLLLAGWGTDLLLALAPQDLPRRAGVAVDGRVLGFALAVSALVALLSALAPALQTARTDPVRALADGPASTVGARSQALRRLLITGEVALALMLLVGASLLGRSFLKLLRLDLGYDPRNVLTLDVSPAQNAYTKPDERRELYESMVERVEALPGVRSAALVLLRPLWGQVGMDWPFTVEGQAKADAKRNPLANLEAVTPGYFRTMGLPLLRGRDFTVLDGEGGPGVVIVSRAFSERHWPGQDPIGKRLKLPLPGTSYHLRWLSVVGVAADARYREMKSARLDLYLPCAQYGGTLNHLVVRTDGDPAALAGPVRAVLRDLDPHLPVSDVATMETLVSAALREWRFSLEILTAFAGAALALALIGIYGVVAQSVAQRTREIALRVALGARSADLLRLVMRQAVLPAGLGLVLGLAGTLALVPVLRSQLFEVSPTDPAVILATVLLLLAAAVAASLLPARRAVRADPAAALRQA